MTSWSSIVEKMNIRLDKTIHITPKCTKHLHGHRNKGCPSWSLLYLWILTMMLNSIATHVGRLMTLIIIVFHVGSITTTLATKTWFSWVMKRLARNEIPNVKAYRRSFYIVCPLFQTRTYMTFLMVSCVTICWTTNRQHVKCVLYTFNSCSYSHVKTLEA